MAQFWTSLVFKIPLRHCADWFNSSRVANSTDKLSLDKIYFCFVGIYNAPGKSTLDQYRQHIEALPDIDKPEFFGMNENANIAFQKRDGSSLVSTLSQIQPFMPGDDGKSNNEVVNELADSILNVLVDKLDMVEADVNVGQKKSQDVVNALSGVLSNEVLRYNRLLSVIKVRL